MVHKYDSNMAQDLRELERRLDQLEATMRRTALTTASQGWILPNRSTPAAPANGAHLYASGGRVMIRQADGTTFPLEPVPDMPFVQGPALATLPVFNSPPSPPQTVQGIWDAYRLLRDDCQYGIRSWCIQLKAALEATNLFPSA